MRSLRSPLVAALVVGLMVGVAVAKKREMWEPTTHEEHRAELLTQVEVEHEIMGVRQTNAASR